MSEKVETAVEEDEFEEHVEETESSPQPSENSL
jgi:hypothetical protein